MPKLLSRQSTLNRLMLFIVFALVASVAHAGRVGEAYEPVELGKFIKQNYPHKKNGKSIVPPKNISFYGEIMQLPTKGEFSYVYVALEVMKVTPLPNVSHQMYVSDDKGNVISMYVEKHAAEVFNKYLKLGQRPQFKGYHVYNYKRGPAIIIEGIIEAGSTVSENSKLEGKQAKDSEINPSEAAD